MKDRNRIDRRFIELKSKKEKALITYVCAGDPDLTVTEQLILQMADSGADVIELGVPYSDPIADGPVIQAAGQRALQNGVKTENIFLMVQQVRAKTQVPLILMIYYNCILQYGVERFSRRCAEAGVDGVIVPDLPLEESEEMHQAAEVYDVALVMLVAPTTPAERIRRIAQFTSGFLYCVSVTGVTGTRKMIDTNLRDFLQLVRKEAGEKTPLAVGFGVSDPGQAAEMSAMADGVIVGSAVIKVIEKYHDKTDMVEQVGRFVEQLKSAITPKS